LLVRSSHADGKFSIERQEQNRPRDWQPPLALAICDSIAHALDCRFVNLKKGKTVWRVFQSSLDAAIRDIKNHPRGKLFCRLIEFGPHNPDELKGEPLVGQ
jgi:hypothetical protein